MNRKTFRRGLAMASIVALTGLMGISAANATKRPWDDKDNRATGGVCQRDARPLQTMLIKTARVPAVLEWREVRKAKAWHTSVIWRGKKTYAKVMVKPAVEPIVLGNQQLVHSPNCRTVWAEVYAYKPYGRTTAYVERRSDGKRLWCESGTAMFCRTKMVNGKDVKSFAKGWIQYKGHPVGGQKTRDF